MKSKTGKNTQTLRSSRPLSILETYKADCEAREWLMRFQSKAKEIGVQQAKTWWSTIIEDIEKKRGIESANDLRARMNHEKSK
jgi:hypothetical protein